MKRASVRKFWLDYFHATHDVCWLSRLMSGAERVKMLQELMQWEVTRPCSKE
ncbi:glucose uptake inhibitor SgrT [Vagococcus sp. WN89Y]|uniref:glucose uptake inhibitor SgrT n=1 Tax=Vagococcus sp. WN89Y TaxID=3457258 RepID=UPI003FCED6A8